VFSDQLPKLPDFWTFFIVTNFVPFPKAESDLKLTDPQSDASVLATKGGPWRNLLESCAGFPLSSFPLFLRLALFGDSLPHSHPRSKAIRKTSGITQNRPVRVTSKPDNGEGSGH